MKKRNFRSLFAGRNLNKAKVEEEGTVAIPGVEKLILKDAPPKAVVDTKVEEVEVEKEKEEDLDWGEDVPDEESSKRSEFVESVRDGPRFCDSYSVASSLPTNASSKVLRHVKTFDYSDASSFSLASRRSADLYDPNDAESILANRIPPSLLRIRPPKNGDDSCSIANSSVTTRGSASVLFQTHTFDLSGTSMFGPPKEESETSSERLEESSSDNRDRKDSTDLAQQGAGMATVFGQDVHSFFDRVFNNHIAEGDEE